MLPLSQRIAIKSLKKLYRRQTKDYDFYPSLTVNNSAYIHNIYLASHADGYYIITADDECGDVQTMIYNEKETIKFILDINDIMLIEITTTENTQKVLFCEDENETK
jgi:hypothetical protein